MKKIMFNDRYGLTQAVLSGRKTMTRRIISYPNTFKGEWVAGFHVYRRQSDGVITEYPCMYDADERDIDGGYILPKYKVGEVVAIAQPYAAIGYGDNAPIIGMDENGMPIFASEAGIYNKMFVRADLMPHYIRITNVRIERLQDISDEDCIKEGIIKGRVGSADTHFMDAYYLPNKPLEPYPAPRVAFAVLIDKVSGKGTWESNPYVLVYEYELVK